MGGLQLTCRGKLLDLTSRTHIMGIINCTPDSFYAGSRQANARQAIDTGVRMVEDGADILDVGGESTRPGSEPVPEEEELRRVLPVVEGLLKRVEVPISVDTYKSAVAERALKLGAHIVNDISGLRFDPEMAGVAARYEAPVVVMHIKGKPKDMQADPHYDDVVGELHAYFEERLAYAEARGIPRSRIVLDPGIGFGKRLEDNYEILRRLPAFLDFGCPILVGPSRKSFIGRVLDVPPEEALEGTIAASVVVVLKGAHIVRVHDVREVGRALRITDKLARGRTRTDAVS